MSSHGDRVLGVLIVVGIAGSVAGHLWTKTSRAWRDVTAAKDALNTRRGLAWSATGWAIAIGFGLIVLVAAMIGQRNS